MWFNLGNVARYQQYARRLQTIPCNVCSICQIYVDLASKTIRFHALSREDIIITCVWDVHVGGILVFEVWMVLDEEVLVV